MSRRGFMMGCSAAIAAMAGGRLTFTAFGSPEDEPNQEIVVVVFLRGGADGLSIVPPIDGDDRGYYEGLRERLAIPTTGDNAALPLTDLFGLHPAAGGLHELYQGNHLAFVHASGLDSDTRSHFDAMAYMELGTPDSKSSTSGWLTRHMATMGLPADAVLPAISVGNLRPTSLNGSTQAVGMSSPRNFSFNGHWAYDEWERHALREMYTGNTWLHDSGLETLNTIDTIELAAPENYEPEGGAEYPGGSFGNNLQSIAQMIKMQLGLRVATMDLGGWDTHDGQGNGGGGYFSNQMGQLSNGLNALYTDLAAGATDYTQRVTIVVMSEFGRSFKENANGGTDHGHGNVMMVLGGQVNGGQVYTDWPGLATENLYDFRDLDITIDYRQVLSEILIRRFGNANIGTVFPGYQNYTPLGIMKGTDLTPNYEELLLTSDATPTATSTAIIGSTIPAETATSTPQPTATPVPPTATPTSTPTNTSSPTPPVAGQENTPTPTPGSVQADPIDELSSRDHSTFLPLVNR
ncbi:MAG: DUF1501 domain-containing protein [Chloroflexota bacterium]